MTDSRGTKGEWVGIGDLVSDMVGHPDKATADIITRHAKEPSKKGFASIPPEFVRRGTNPDNRKQRFQYQLSLASKVFFENLLALEGVLPSRHVAKILRGESVEAAGELRRAFEAARREAELKWETYGKWLINWKRLENRVLDPATDLHAEPLFGVDLAGLVGAMNGLGHVSLWPER